MLSLRVLPAFLLAAVMTVNAETHNVRMNNKCGSGKATLIQGSNVLKEGTEPVVSYTANGPISGSIAYLQTGKCGFNGDGCMTVEVTLLNNAISSVDLSLIPPLAYSVKTGFNMIDSCAGNGGRVCDNPNCDTAFHKSDDNQVQVQCRADQNNAGVEITFC